MSKGLIIVVSILYLSLLFLIAFYAEKRSKAKKSIVNNPYIYSFSLAVYCTAWTFFGSVGRASTQGLGYLPIYIGPAILAPLFFVIVHKIILISKHQRITSIADFISSRYGKSTSLGVLTTIICVFGIIPYISIQLKAIATTYDILSSKNIHATSYDAPFYTDSALYITIALALFTILFGTRNLDPNERHEGLVASVAFESLIKLLAFLIVGVYVTFGIFNGFGDLFATGKLIPQVEQMFSFEKVEINPLEWFILIFLSMSAIIFLPRQFHLTVVENTNPKFVAKASWLFSLYLLLINIFVIPIAIAGIIHFQGQPIAPDTYIINLPLALGNDFVAIIVGIGGFAAATSMVIVAVIALSIMISNNLVLPLLLKPKAWSKGNIDNISDRLLGIRRVSIIIVLLIAYAYFKQVGSSYSLVSIGLISFTAIAQFVPVILGGIYWKKATKLGAKVGLISGFIVWGYTLPFPTLVESQVLNSPILTNGLWGLNLLHPYELFGLSGWDHISHSFFWSLLINTFSFVFVSLYSKQGQLEVSQADIFVEINKYNILSSNYEVIRRQAKTKDIIELLTRFLGLNKTSQLINTFERTHKTAINQNGIASPEWINFAEKHLTGAIGAASAKIIIGSISKEDPISLGEMFEVLEQTQEIIQYSKALERKSAELEYTTKQLIYANEQLKELDELKAEFITTVTHELRTPITSIKALSQILTENDDIPDNKKNEFLSIIVKESDRITRLINQVLDLEKAQNPNNKEKYKKLNFVDLVEQAYHSLSGYMQKREIAHHFESKMERALVLGDKDKIIQIVINLLSNAIKFCNANAGKIDIIIDQQGKYVRLQVQDNGKGIAPKEKEKIFQKFTQLNDQKLGKPKGSGLGLFITKTLIDQHKGKINVENIPQSGANFIVLLPLST
ncbi:MAG: sensor histidine kinase [Bacteroidota bacterium]